ncbi:SRPBCC family protein [Microbacterium excoecariae]|uniref:SRPBCC family protein n=1 Tax=Microbacterium excoecariae TaxID=2715210 RepID=UPI001408CFF8|nr:SRPBCC family protein [Microbacterium excoecariae]NHI16965.1 ATPase [Microbacterium excoecariae]
MPITSIDTDHDALTTTIVADFAAPPQQVWDAYADPRIIERFWGPEEWPATFTRHDMFPGGQSRYTMTGPDGDTSSGYWEFLAVDAPRSFEVLDGFCGPDGEPNRDMPSMRMTYRFDETASGTRMTSVTYFHTLEELEQLVAMGMEEGTASAMSQIDAVLADLSAFAADRATQLQELFDTQVRISRVVAGTPEQVWRAHHDADLLARWMLGPDGWTMTEATPPGEPGSAFRYAWAPEDPSAGAPFAIAGEVLESDAPHRLAHTERMEDMPGETRNEMTLTPVPGGTLLVYVITYPSAEVRGAVLATGMVDGMEASYRRLDGVAAGA